MTDQLISTLSIIICCVLFVWIVFAINSLLFEPKYNKPPRKNIFEKMIYCYEDRPIRTIIYFTIAIIAILKIRG